MKRNPEKFSEGSFINSYGLSSTWDRAKWEFVKQHYSDRIQLDLLRALTVVAVHPGMWEFLFMDLYHGKYDWEGVNKNWFESKRVPTYDELFAIVASRTQLFVPYPEWHPNWLVEYGYTQFQYIADLKACWIDIASGYYSPWPSSRIGYDTVAYDAIKQLSQETQADIEQLIESAKLVLHLAKNGDSHDNEQKDES